MNNQESIDLVYLWCDMSDEAWNARRKEVAKHWPDVIKDDEEAVSRYQSHDELRYSIRSAEMYAPWIHKIFIVIADDNALPLWLDTTNPRLRIVRHSEIIPSEYLPCYNSPTMEHFISRIPDLSEKFLYSNDDMFFFDNVSPDFFFDENDKPIRRVNTVKFGLYTDNYYQHTLYNADKLVKASHPDIETQVLNILQFQPHHGIDSYRKSHNLETFERYKNEITEAIKCPFRMKDDIQRAIYLMEEVATYGAKTVITDNQPQPDSLCYSGRAWRYGLDNVLRLRPSLLCINAWSENTPDDFEWIRLAMEMLYPTPSSFEKKTTPRH